MLVTVKLLLLSAALSSCPGALTSARHLAFSARHRLLTRRDLDSVSDQLSSYKALGGSSLRDLPDTCRTCTIVGNAGTLKGSGLGTSVDSSDCVFRLGVAPTTGHEQDVGTKTTFRIITGDSFLDLFRRPERLTSGDLRADIWVLFGHSNVDPLKVGLKLRQLPRGTNLTVLTVTQAGETDALRTFKLEAARIGYTQSGKQPSTAWHAVQVAAQSGCTKTSIVGVPGPKFCKSHANSYHGKTDSRYWGSSSPSLCSHGKDWGSGPLTSHDRIMSLDDRRAIKGWALERSSLVTFKAPTWDLTEL